MQYHHRYPLDLLELSLEPQSSPGWQEPGVVKNLF